MDFVLSVLLLELDDGVLPDSLLELELEAPEGGFDVLEGSVEVELPEVAPLFIDALPLAEPDMPGAALLLEAEPGVVVSVDVAAEELGEDGVVVAVGLDDVLLLVPDLLRSQPVTAAVATASTATRGMSLFMTSPFRLRFVWVGRSLSGPGLRTSMGDRCRSCAKRVCP
ncbi:MAG TPA: hypothetical protein VFJ86_08635 [Usitatibacter sp.]|nr:hypothetical protein [Usitatibacter sp.]